jgi:hypothetical protein
VVAVPTAMIANPVFGREIGTTAWAWPVLGVTAALSGLLFATYVREPDAGADVDVADEATAPTGGREPGRAGAVGGLLTFLAVGCPVCNKLALVALGYSGAIQWFAPVQPVLGAAGVVLLAWALVRRLAAQDACPVPAGRAAAAGGAARNTTER